MKLREILRIAWEAITRNKVRSVLTMLGIIIGVAAVIIMIAISRGTEATIQEEITSLGSNLIFLQSSMSMGGASVMGGVSSGGGMTFEAFGPSGGLVYDDAAAIAENITGVRAVVVEQSTSQTVKVGDISIDSVSILGTTEGFPSVRDMEIASGRYFTTTEIDRSKKVAVLGSTLAEELFPDSDPLGQVLLVDTTQFVVIGVLAPKGSVGETDYDTRLYIPITVVFKKFTFSMFARFQGDSVRMIYVELDPEADRASVITQIQLLLAKRHELTVDTLDVTITTQEDIITTQESTTSAFRSLLAWVAGVSLVVGGIGIMNIMLVSVTERTREIGIRQAIGATPEDIRRQFLAEALLLSVFGGLLGTLVGVAGASIFSLVSGMRTVIAWESILLAFGSAAAVGAFFGFYPASRAARMDPIEALRYE